MGLSGEIKAANLVHQVWVRFAKVIFCKPEQFELSTYFDWGTTALALDCLAGPLDCGPWAVRLRASKRPRPVIFTYSPFFEVFGDGLNEVV